MNTVSQLIENLETVYVIDNGFNMRKGRSVQRKFLKHVYI